MLLLLVAAFIAGFVDSIVGGGGLIQLPALMISFPQAAMPSLLGTNKFSSFWGTAFALFRYSKSLKIPWKKITPSAALAFFGTFVGAYLSTQLPKEVFRPLVIVIVFLVFIYTILKKELGLEERVMHKRHLYWGTALIAFIGFYDGLIGPGTGGFLIFCFVSFFGMKMLNASAAAKVVNLGTNAAALSFFIFTNHVLYKSAVPMAFANIMGNLLGTHFATKHGSIFVRKVFIVVMALLIARLLWN